MGVSELIQSIREKDMEKEEVFERKLLRYCLVDAIVSLLGDLELLSSMRA